MKKSAILLALALSAGLAFTALADYDEATVKSVQQALNDAGFDCGEPDGIAGENTAAAITAYESAKGLAQDGVISDSLLVSLGLAQEAPAENEEAIPIVIEDSYGDEETLVMLDGETPEEAPAEDAEEDTEAETEAETEPPVISYEGVPDPDLYDGEGEWVRIADTYEIYLPVGRKSTEIKEEDAEEDGPATILEETWESEKDFTVEVQTQPKESAGSIEALVEGYANDYDASFEALNINGISGFGGSVILRFPRSTWILMTEKGDDLYTVMVTAAPQKGQGTDFEENAAAAEEILKTIRPAATI